MAANGKISKIDFYVTIFTFWYSILTSVYVCKLDINPPSLNTITRIFENNGYYLCNRFYFVK